jgi:hypothetical protein
VQVEAQGREELVARAQLRAHALGTRDRLEQGRGDGRAR